VTLRKIYLKKNNDENNLLLFNLETIVVLHSYISLSR